MCRARLSLCPAVVRFLCPATLRLFIQVDNVVTECEVATMSSGEELDFPNLFRSVPGVS